MQLFFAKTRCGQDGWGRDLERNVAVRARRKERWRRAKSRLVFAQGQSYRATGIRMEPAVQSRTARQAVGCRFLPRQNSTAER